MLQIQYLNSKLNNNQIEHILNNYNLKYITIKNEIESKIGNMIKLFLKDIQSYLENITELANQRDKIKKYDSIKRELVFLQNKYKEKIYTEFKLKNDIKELQKENFLLKIKNQKNIELLNKTNTLYNQLIQSQTSKNQPSYELKKYNASTPDRSANKHLHKKTQSSIFKSNKFLQGKILSNQEVPNLNKTIHSTVSMQKDKERSDSLSNITINSKTGKSEAKKIKKNKLNSSSLDKISSGKNSRNNNTKIANKNIKQFTLRTQKSHKRKKINAKKFINNKANKEISQTIPNSPSYSLLDPSVNIKPTDKELYRSNSEKKIQIIKENNYSPMNTINNNEEKFPIVLDEYEEIGKNINIVLDNEIHQLDKNEKQLELIINQLIYTGDIDDYEKKSGK